MSRESLSLSFRGLPVHFSIVRPEAHLRHRVLLLCSPLLTGFHWRKLLPELSELGCLCVLAELPGFGQGAAASAFPHNSTTRARLIWGVLDEVDARIGGQNALWHLAAHGCACPTVMAHVRDAAGFRAIAGGDLSPCCPRMAAGATSPGARTRRSALSSAPLLRSRPLPALSSAPPAGRCRTTPWNACGPALPAPADAMRCCACSGARTRCPRSAGFCPAIAIWGGSDPLLPADARERLTALQPEVEAHIIRPAGHFPMETHSRALRDYLRGWLKYVS